MSEDKAIIQSRGRKDMLWAIVVIVAALGGVYEYQQITTPLDEAIIFLSPTTKDTSVKAPENIEPQPVPNENKENKNQENKDKQALKELLNYMDEINAKANQLISYEGNALSHIKGLPTVKEAIKPDTHIFEDGKIEIYDSQKGVVDVVDTKAPGDDAKLKQNVAEETKAENTSDETTQMSAQEQAEAIAHQQVQQQVAMDLQKVAEDGEEAPVVLLPGMGVPAVTNSDEEAEETIDLNETTDEIVTDAEKINRAMQQVEMLNIEGLVPQAEAPVQTESAKLPQTDAEVRILGDDGADGGVINMLNQITRQ